MPNNNRGVVRVPLIIVRSLYLEISNLRQRHKYLNLRMDNQYQDCILGYLASTVEIKYRNLIAAS